MPVFVVLVLVMVWGISGHLLAGVAASLLLICATSDLPKIRGRRTRKWGTKTTTR